MGREFRIQSALRRSFPLVPAMVAFCDDDAVLGSDFYVMDRVDGTILRREPAVAAATRAVSALCGRTWDVLGELHAVDVAAVPALAALGRGEGYVARQVAGWTERLARAATDDLGDWAAITDLARRTAAPDVGQCLIHNDFRLDNVVLAPDDPERVVAVLDWEMATVGDPLMDLGGALAYWIEDSDDAFMRRFRPALERSGDVVAPRDRGPLLRAEGTHADAGGVAVLRGVRAVPARRHRPADLVPLRPRADHQRGLRDLRPAVGALERRCRALVGT